MSVRLAKFKRSDVDELYRINKKSLPVYYSKVDHMDFIMKKDHIVCVIENEKGIVGYCIAHHHSNNRFHIISIAVDEKERRKGYGILLINFLVNETKRSFKGISKLTLYVMESNDDARAFYKKMDFTDKKVLINYYGLEKNGIILEKEI